MQDFKTIANNHTFYLQNSRNLNLTPLAYPNSIVCKRDKLLNALTYYQLVLICRAN